MQPRHNLAFLLLAVGTVGIGLGQAPDYRKPAAAEWPLVGGDWGNTRYSLLSQINPANVKTLKGAWMARLNSGFGPGFSQQATPVIKDGVMYITTGQQDIFALDAKTGAMIWEFRPEADPKTPDNKAKRGVGLGDGMVFGVLTDIRKPAPPTGRVEPVLYLLALDQKTGKLLWKHELGEDVPKGFRKYISAPPLYYKGLVYMSISGGDGGLRGRLTAHDAKTGNQVWRWNAIPGPGEPGNETWEGESWKTGGGAMWVQPALDPDLGLLYVNTGNPWPDYNGSTRGGNNLFTDSVVALDAMTGAYRWHFQSVHHDLWDFDMPTPLILFDQVYNGEMHHALAAHSKQAWVYILDRVSGKPLIDIEEKPVPQEPRQKTVATQPIPVGDPTAPQCGEPVKGYQQGCMFTAHWSDTKIAQPSAAGDWAPGRLRSPVRLFVLRHRSGDASVQPGDTNSDRRDSGIWNDHGARFADEQKGMAERSPLSGRLRKRAAGYRRRAAFPWRLRRFLSLLRFQKRRGALAFSDGLRGGCAGRNVRN